MTSLARFTLLNTRPAHQAQGLSDLVELAGGQVLNCPTLEIQWDSQTALRASLIKDLEQYDKVILTSVNAVQGLLHSGLQNHFKSNAPNEFLKTQFFAIGKATQEAALHAQLPVEHLHDGSYDSEGLLQHPAMQSVTGESILIVKGHGGRNLLVQELTEKGGLVDIWDVYRRVYAEFCPDTWQAFVAAPQPILLITSVASFESLIAGLLKFDQAYKLVPGRQTQTHQAWSFLSATIVFSERIKQAMFQQGWKMSVQVVRQQSDSGIVQAVEQCLNGQIGVE